MLLYLFSIGENGTGHYGKEVRQAGVLYMPATYEAVGADPGTSREQIEKEHQKMLRMSGLLLDEEEVLRAMEPTLGGRFIPVSVKKDGTMAAYSSVASEKQFGLLRRHAEKLLLDMGKELLSGELKMNPFKQGADSCEYCEYRAACRFDVASGTGRRYQAIKDAEIWNLLGEEERHVDK